MTTDFAEPLSAATLVGWYAPAAVAVPIRGTTPAPLKRSLRLKFKVGTVSPFIAQFGSSVSGLDRRPLWAGAFPKKVGDRKTPNAPRVEYTGSPRSAN